jgi:hypothetical protein
MHFLSGRIGGGRCANIVRKKWLQEIEDLKIATWVRYVVEKNTLGWRSRSPVARSVAECSLSSRDRSVVPSLRRAVQREPCSRRGDTLPRSSNAACANAVSTHCIASVHAAASPTRFRERGVARPTKPSSATLGINRTLLALQVYSLRCWYGSRTRDSQIIGLVLYPLS